ncbi:hypothetical protein [Leptospira stimsonii]|nr:hypothetical protein [Leptospira stimsonii]
MWIELFGSATALCAFLIGAMFGVNHTGSLSLRIGSFLFVAISIWLG